MTFFLSNLPKTDSNFMYPFKFEPFPELRTQRLHLRELRAADEESVFSLKAHPEVVTYINRPLARERSEAQYFIQEMIQGRLNGLWVYWGICLNDWPEVIGTICLWHLDEINMKADIGYEMHPDFQGLGYMREAAAEVLHYGFQDLELRSIDAITQPKNQRSRHLLNKLSFEFVKELTESEKLKKERDLDLALFRLPQKRWQEARNLTP